MQQFFSGDVDDNRDTGFSGVITSYSIHYTKLYEKKKFYWISVGCFVLGLFTLEFVLLFPAILAMVFWCLRVDEPVLKRSRWLCLQMIPFAVAIGVWFLANKLLFGLWIGHYGAETHTAIHPIANSATELKYLVKIFAFTRFLSFEAQTQLYQILDTQVAGFTSYNFV